MSEKGCKLLITDCVVCEDIREEVGGSVSLIGVSPGEMLVQSVTDKGSFDIAVYLSGWLEGRGDCELHTQLAFENAEGEVISKVAAKALISHEYDGKSAAGFPTPKARMNISETGAIVVSWRSGDRQKWKEAHRRAVSFERLEKSN